MQDSFQRYLIAALSGELGPQVKVAMETANTEETIEALQDLIGAFGGDDVWMV